jgi:hypothetical protein
MAPVAAKNGVTTSAAIAALFPHPKRTDIHSNMQVPPKKEGRILSGLHVTFVTAIDKILWISSQRKWIQDAMSFVCAA